MIKNTLIIIGALFSTMMLSSGLNARCPQMLYFTDLATIFIGQPLNTPTGGLVKQQGAKDTDIRKDMLGTFYPAGLIWADLVSDDNNSECSYNYRRGLTRLTASKIPFKLDYVVNAIPMTKDEARKVLGVQLPLNPHTLKLKFTNIYNAFNDDQDKTVEKIKNFSKKHEAFVILYTDLGQDFEAFRKELGDNAPKR